MSRERAINQINSHEAMLNAIVVLRAQFGTVLSVDGQGQQIRERSVQHLTDGAITLTIFSAVVFAFVASSSVCLAKAAHTTVK